MVTSDGSGTNAEPDDALRASVIGTHSVARGFVESDVVVLSETATTRILFRPGMSDKGVRGHIIRQKKNGDGTWTETNDINFRTAPPGTAVDIELDTEAVEKLVRRVGELYEIQGRGLPMGDHQYVVAPTVDVVIVDDKNQATIIRQLIEQGHSAEVWRQLSEINPQLASGLASAEIYRERLEAIKHFEELLVSEPDDESMWQEFFESNPWILESVFSSVVFMLAGETYVGGKKSQGRQGHGGVATDFLFADESTKSFAVVEIKKPEENLVGGRYRGTREGDSNEVFTPSSALSGGVVQVRTQISVAVEHFESVLGADYRDKIDRVHPKGVLIIGMKSSLEDRELASFNHFRHGQYSLTVITYDELLGRLKLLYPSDSTAEPS